MKALQRGNGVYQEVDGVPIQRSGTSEGTGSDQEVVHGFSSSPKRVELIPLESGVVFSGLTVTATDFHVTVTNGKSWAWVAVQW